jgi:hypothetical protein
MRYCVFRAAGYDIGSGAVEDAWKHVVGNRLKQSGMIWTRAGSAVRSSKKLFMGLWREVSVSSDNWLGWSFKQAPLLSDNSRY